MVFRALRIVLVAGLLTVLMACQQSDPPAGAKSPVASGKVEQRSSVSKGPPVIDPALASTGGQLYNQNCIFCHQADAIGKPGFAPSLTNKEFLSVASVEFLLSTIRDGRAGTGMPPFAHLGEKKIEAIVAFLRAHATLPDRAAAIDAQPATQGDQRLGKIWYDQICLSCHGSDGDGYAAGGTGTAIGKSSFLGHVTDGFIRTTIKEGRTNTRMMSFQGPESMADLSDKEIDDIIAYLRTTPSQN